jgi:uncharacterized BrkB/YihY/UPF0761 family membrane protein
MANAQFWKQFGVAIAVAMVGVLIVWLIASLISPDILVDTPSGDDQKLEWWGPSLAIIFPYGIVTAIVAWLLVRFQKPRLWWYVIAVVALVATGAQAFMQANTTESAIWLNVMHLVAAGCIVPTVARFLPER